jgi:MinD superfamily P-loop ATPase
MTDPHRSGRPRTASTDRNTHTKKKAVRENQCVTVTKPATVIGYSNILFRRGGKFGISESLCPLGCSLSDVVANTPKK